MAHRAAMHKQIFACLWAYAITPHSIEELSPCPWLACSSHHVDFHSKDAGTHHISSWIISISSSHQHIHALVWAHSAHIVLLNSASIWSSPCSWGEHGMSQIHDRMNQPFDILASSGWSWSLPGPLKSTTRSSFRRSCHNPIESRALKGGLVSPPHVLISADQC